MVVEAIGHVEMSDTIGNMTADGALERYDVESDARAR